MNYFVYIIKSKVRNYYYVGMTNNVERRIDQHNKGRVRSTKAYKPFRLIYSKKFDSRENARNYEKYLKVRSNKEKLLETI